MSGIFITIGGIDGCGGTTHSRLLYEWLKKKFNKNVILTKEPTDGEIGKILRKYLKDKKSNIRTDALLFAADRIEHIENIIKPALNQNMIVISDRYIESSLAYQCAQGLSLNWILEINQGFIKPDLTIILDIEPEIALKRKDYIEDKFENIEFLKKVRLNYLEQAKLWNYKIINSNREIDIVHEEIIKEVEHIIKYKYSE